MAVLAVIVRSNFAATIVEGWERLCDSQHPETGEVCYGSGSHRGPHSNGSVLANSVRRWPNERVRVLDPDLYGRKIGFLFRQ